MLAYLTVEQAAAGLDAFYTAVESRLRAGEPPRKVLLGLLADLTEDYTSRPREWVEEYVAANFTKGTLCERLKEFTGSADVTAGVVLGYVLGRTAGVITSIRQANGELR